MPSILDSCPKAGATVVRSSWPRRVVGFVAVASGRIVATTFWRRVKWFYAVAAVASKSYATAARAFVELAKAAGGDRDGAPEAGAAAPGRDAVPPGDFAACAALLALASLPRDELKRSCVEDVAFKNAVASLPRVKALLSDALSGSYAAALRELAAIVDELSFDPALRPHAAHLGALARDMSKAPAMRRRHTAP